jgi:hypothetical protein
MRFRRETESYDPFAEEIIRVVGRETRKRILLATLDNFLNKVMSALGFKRRFGFSARPPVDYGPF